MSHPANPATLARPTLAAEYALGWEVATAKIRDWYVEAELDGVDPDDPEAFEAFALGLEPFAADYAESAVYAGELDDVGAFFAGFAARLDLDAC